MLKPLHLACALALVLAAVGPVGSATASAQTKVAQASQTGTGIVSGFVTNQTTHAAVAGARVKLTGPNTLKSATTDDTGSFTFDDLPAGTYSLRTTAKGYVLSTSAPFAVASGEHVTLAVALQQVTSTTLKLIGSVRVNGAQALNTTSAPTVTITNRDFVQKGQVLVEQGLETVPGVTVQHFDGGLGSVATLTIRGAGGFADGANNTGYEVLILQDGEPVRNGQYGDYDLSALTPAIYSRVEVLKGVGGTSLFGANSIGGTLNLVTRDPLKTFGAEFIGSAAGFGMTDANLALTDTMGKFGYLLDLHQLGTDGPVPYNLLGDYSSGCTSLSIPAADGGCFLAHPQQGFNLKSGLAKLSYAFSPVTSLVITGTDESDWRNQLGLVGNPTTQNGASLDPFGYQYFFGFPGDYVWNIQPKVSVDLRTLVGGGNLILRSYGGILERVVDGLNEDPATCCFLSRSVDRLYGTELYYTKLFGRHTVTFAAGGNGDNFFFAQDNLFAPATFAQLTPTAQGTQVERTYLVSDDFEYSPKLTFDLAGYYSTYDTLNVKRFDPRFGVVFRPNVQTAVHFSVGSGFAPPRLSDIYTPLDLKGRDAVSDPRCPSIYPFGACAASSGNPNLKAETAVGYDLGADHVFGQHGRVSLDLYRTNLHGHLFSANVPAPPGLVFTGKPSDGGGLPVVFINTPLNLSAYVYTGIEFSGQLPVSRNFAVNAFYDTQAAYPTDLEVSTQNFIQAAVNNEQTQGVPLHKYGYGIAYYNDAGASAFANADYFGKNNAFGFPPFWVYNAGISVPAGENNTLHFIWNNITNVNAGLFEGFGQGVPYAGFSGPFTTSTHPYQPHSFMVTFDHRVGSLVDP